MGLIDTISNIAGADDWGHDPWGTTIGLHFEICDVLDASDIAGDVTPAPFARWEYYRGAVATVPDIDTIAAQADAREGEWTDEYSFGAVMLASAYRVGHITQADLIKAGDILSRYAGLLRSAGRDY